MQGASRAGGPAAEDGTRAAGHRAPGSAEVHAALPLRGPAEILLDRWGIPHIYAGCADDLFFAQGFNAARDRLWQIDLWRRRGLGLLAQALGPAYVARDRAARLFLYRGPMEQEWTAYGCDLRSVVEPFVTGINAYIALTERRPELLPPEFAALGYRPAAGSPTTCCASAVMAATATSAASSPGPRSCAISGRPSRRSGCCLSLLPAWTPRPAWTCP